MVNVKRIILIVAAAATLAACTDTEGAKRALDDAGFENVEIQGWPGLWDGCGKDDNFSTKFRALNMKGKSVTGVVCSGWFKGSTIRFD